ncbi:unnamed protein product [Citrullus colocynthis]|uniref:Uncharacterized protein n=1 Tax=Citrullus colocynthis TaxID=252529 RepID=A0ABP0YB01_9ROSI
MGVGVGMGVCYPPSKEAHGLETLKKSQPSRKTQNFQTPFPTVWLVKSFAVKFCPTSIILCGSNAFVYDGCLTENIGYGLKQLESVLMGPNNEEVVSKPDVSFGNTSRQQMIRQRSYSWRQDRRGGSYVVPSQTSPVSRSQQYEAELWIACVKALTENRMKDFDNLVATATGVVSTGGDPFQRLGAYMVEGLVARKEESGVNIYRALNYREPALATRPNGPPHVRIIGINDPISKYAHGDGLEVVERWLVEISMKYGIPVEFHGVLVFAPDITLDMLDIKPRETLAINFPLQLHHTPNESVDVNNPRDNLLRMVKSLSLEVVTLEEQESNTNTTPFFNRFVETVDYYVEIFVSIDVTLPRNNKNHINVKQHCLEKEIINVIACEGSEQEKHHELFGKWKSRLTMADFHQFPLISYVTSVIRSLLRYYSKHYTLVEKDGAMPLGWKNRNLISASTWY